MAQGKSIKDKVSEVINEYVRYNGTNHIMTEDEIRELVAKKYDINKGSFQLTDYCYNLYNDGLRSNFELVYRMFQQIETKVYRILGSDYPYTGEVYHTSQDKDTRVEGVWIKGKFYKNSEEEVKTISKYLENAEHNADMTDNEIDNIGLEGKEKEQIVKVRINQGMFRELLTRRYKHCCLCGVSNQNLLIASHIKPWSEASAKEKLDINNGLLLCPNHDKLFDNDYISFDDNGNILISEDLESNDRVFMNINENMSILMYEENRKYMEYHRDFVFRK